MKRIWLDSYPEGVPHDININKYDSVLEIFKESCLAHADKPAYTNFDYTITFAQLEQYVNQFAYFLQTDLGLAKGDRMAIMLPNVIQYPIAVLGAMRLGVVVVNIDPMYTQRELVLQLNDSGAKTVLVLENFAKEVQLALPNVDVDNVIVTKIGDCFPWTKAVVINNVVKHIKKAVPDFHIDNVIEMRGALRKYAKIAQHELVDAELSHEDLFFLQYTGGTTGVPKGVELTHGNLIANIMMSSAWLKPALNDTQQRIIAPLPMYHIFCMSVNLLTMMSMGIENILVTNPRDFKGFTALLKKNRFTGFVAVTTLLRKLLDTPGFDQIDFSELKFTFAGGMAVTRDVAEEWLEVTGCPVIEAYGLSETAPGVCSVPFCSSEFTGNIGLPLPSTHIKLLDDDDNEVGLNQSGELCVKGPQVMRGYWKRPDATAEVMTEDGYLRTGDYVSMNEKGYLKILDRKKDMILVSGFNAFPNELEDVVNQHPKVTESAAIGIDNRESGQVVKMFIVPNTPDLSKDEVVSYCKEHLTGYKRPKEIVFVDDLPKSNVGKILRKELH